MQMLTALAAFPSDVVVLLVCLQVVASLFILVFGFHVFCSQ